MGEQFRRAAEIGGVVAAKGKCRRGQPIGESVGHAGKIGGVLGLGGVMPGELYAPWASAAALRKTLALASD